MRWAWSGSGVVMGARVPEGRRIRQRGRVAFGQVRGGDGREGVVLLEAHDGRQARTQGGKRRRMRRFRWGNDATVRRA
jgi:hypothetical protein